MKINKLLLTFLIISIFSIKGIAQTLTIDETIDYINKLFENSKCHMKIRMDGTTKTRVENERDHFYEDCDIDILQKFSLDQDGYMIINNYATSTNCYNKKNNYENEFHDIAKININDIDLNKVIIKKFKLISDYENENDKINGEAGYATKDGGSVSCQCKNMSERCVYGKTLNQEWEKVNTIHFLVFPESIYTEDLTFDLNRLRNALIYLITLAKEKGYHRHNNNENDPFASHTIINKQSIKSSKCNVPLKEEGGVFTLSVTLGNIIKSRFILDSGAGDCSISTELENKLKASGVIKTKDYISNALYRLADGSISVCKRVKIPKIVVGGKVIFNLVK